MTPSTRSASDDPYAFDDTSPADIQLQQAVVVGVGDYGPALNPLPNAPGDAQAVAQVLKDEYGFTLLPSGAPLLDAAASLPALRTTVQTSLARATEGLRWLFYFAGHGVVADGAGYLLPAGAVPGDLTSYLPLSWLIEQVLSSPCAEVLLILDSCYSGRLLLRGEALDDRPPTPGERRVRQVLSSGNPNQPVLDAGGGPASGVTGVSHSVFTQALLDGLGGWSGIHEPDGRLRFTRLLDHLVFEIPGRLHARGLDAFHQQPIGGYLAGNSDRREFVFFAQVPRLLPDVLGDLGSEDPARRVSGLGALAQSAASHRLEPAPYLQALRLATLLLRPPASGKAAPAGVVPAIAAGPAISTVRRSDLPYEPVAGVRLQAALTLCDLLSSPPAPPPAGLDQELGSGVQALIAALDDAPEVVRPAAQALGRLAPAPVAGPALAARLPAADDVLFLDLADALGALGDPSFSLAALRAALYRGRLVPVLGPDFPTALTGLPDRASAVQALAQQNGLPAPASAASASLADTAAATMLGGSRFAFTNFLYQTYDDQLLQPGPIHAALAKLSAPLWLSAAYDGLLAKALKANSIVLGEDTRYWKPNRPTIVRLAGDPATRRGLVVLEGDWAALRENEGDRRLLLGYLRSELAGKALLFLGFDPTSPDFALLVRHLLNEHLAGLRVAPFLLWPEPPPAPLAWSGLPMRPIPTDPLAFIQALAGTAEKM